MEKIFEKISLVTSAVEEQAKLHEIGAVNLVSSIAKSNISNYGSFMH